jgi:hypothetical protein
MLERQEFTRVPLSAALIRSVSFTAALAILTQTLGPVLAFADDFGPEGAPPTIASPNGLPSDLSPDAVEVTDADAIRAKLDELTIYGRYYDGENWIEYHLADGRTAYWEKGCTYPGKWWVQEGQVCYAYPNYRNGASNCFILFVRPDGSVQFVAIADDGTTYLASFSLKVEHGNSANLPIGAKSPCVGV